MLFVGIDLTEIKRIEKAMQRSHFCKRILGETEYAQLQKRGFPAASVAASFCAKEAFSKALGTGVRGFSLNEVQLVRDDLGKPSLLLEGNAKSSAQQRGLLHFTVSATHTAEYAAVVVVGEGREQNEGVNQYSDENAGTAGGAGRHRIRGVNRKRRRGRGMASAGKSSRQKRRHFMRERE